MLYRIVWVLYSGTPLWSQGLRVHLSSCKTNQLSRLQVLQELYYPQSICSSASFALEFPSLSSIWSLSSIFWSFGLVPSVDPHQRRAIYISCRRLPICLPNQNDLLTAILLWLEVGSHQKRLRYSPRWSWAWASLCWSTSSGSELTTNCSSSSQLRPTSWISTFQWTFGISSCTAAAKNHHFFWGLDSSYVGKWSPASSRTSHCSSSNSWQS